jgi:hypothetical protein
MQTTILIHVSGPPATAINFTQVAEPLIAPVPPGTVLGHLTVEPAGWVGDIAVSGPDAPLLAVTGDLGVGSLDVVALAGLMDRRDYTATIATAE